MPEPVAAPIVTSAPQVNTGVGRRGCVGRWRAREIARESVSSASRQESGGHDSRSRGGKGQIGGGDALQDCGVRSLGKGLCMKNERCTFLHEMDPDRMPECPKGWRCKQSDCPFKHTSEEDREECTLYSQGFCLHGAQCRFRHIKRGPEACPEASEAQCLPAPSHLKSRLRAATFVAPFASTGKQSEIARLAIGATCTRPRAA